MEDRENVIDLNETAAVAIEIPDTAPTRPVRPAKRTANRPIEELHEASIKGMTEPELKAYATALRQELSVMDKRNEMLTQNCNSAYEKVRTMEAQFNDYKQKTSAKWSFAMQTVAQAHNAMIIAARLEE